MIRVMIAEDDTHLNHLCCNYLTKDNDIQIVYSAYDGEEALEKYKELKPDVLILDLGLPKMNGLDVINNICLDESEIDKNNIIIFSGDTFLKSNLLNTSKVFRIIPKLSSNYDKILSAIKDMHFLKNTLSDKKIKDYLYFLNFNTYSDGTIYLIDAIKLAYDKPVLMKNVKDIYSLISKKYTIPHNTVKSSIRNSIDTMERNTTRKEIETKLNVPYSRKLTPKYFIPLVVSHFEN